MSKIIKFDREAKEKLQAGIDKVNKAVSVTMGLLVMVLLHQLFLHTQ